MSTGKDRHEYPELPGDLGNAMEDLDLVRFNKIVLRACRTRPVRRFQSAEDLLTALLSFQFATGELRRAESRRRWSSIIGYSGLLVGVGFTAFCIRRLLHYLSQGQ